jgi:hypothetical protein
VTTRMMHTKGRCYSGYTFFFEKCTPLSRDQQAISERPRKMC